jgi:hypothetical protein
MRVAGVCGVETEVAISLHDVLLPRFAPYPNPVTVSFSVLTTDFSIERKSYMLHNYTARNITLGS